ncbi:glycosyltransferase family 2 protein [Pedobacter sp. P351]|uniref:glycosyltransferase family 2 protein n=1 Tax=Pedobacter superstes TaxID=3133441 RepID=UPI0030AA9C7A
MIYKKSISIIIPNYNGRNLLEEYLPYTFEAISKAGVKFELIIVDDCSTDDSVAFIKSAYPEVKLLINEANRGFSYSCNQGITISENELILLLNSDVKLSPDYFEPQWKYFAESDTFGVMGRIIDMEGDRIQDAARIPKFHGFKIKTEFYYTLDPENKNYSFYLSGANALIDAKKLKQIGGFNELFSPFYGEDLELSLRAWRLGWKCYYEHQSVCRHKASASTNNYKTPQWVKRIYYRNRFFVHAIHLSGVSLVFWILQITFIDLFPRLLAGNLWMWNSYNDLLSNIKEIKKSKRELRTQMMSRGKEITLLNIVKIINDSLKGKEVIRLN